MDHFYTQQKRQTPINYEWQKQQKKKQLKLAWKKTERQMERECKKKIKWNFRPEYSIAYCWRNANLHVRQMSFVGNIDSLANVVFRMANNIACCFASMGTRILLTSLVDLVTGWVRSCFHTARTKWFTWNHCEAKKRKRRRRIKICVILWEQICFSSLFLFKEEDQTNGVY